MLITKISDLSGEIHTMDLPVTEEQMDDFLHRRERRLLIQNIFPQLNPDEREFILTGITAQEWDAAFPEEDED